jgi:hypothetical protein
MRLSEGEPTVDEIVGALRETRRGVGRAPPFTVVGGQRAPGTRSRDGEDGVARNHGVAADARNATAYSTDVADLWDGDIERLLAENARLNERVVFLLKVIEREQARNVEFAAKHAVLETNRGATFRDLRAALEAELRPVLLVMLRLLEKQRADPAGDAVHPTRREALRPAAREAAPYNADGIVDLDAQCV